MMNHLALLLLSCSLFFAQTLASSTSFKDNSEAQLLYNKISENFKNKQFSEAHRLSGQYIKTFEKSIKHAEVFYILGETENDFFKSIFYLRKVTITYPTSYWAIQSQMAIALKYYAIGNYHKAESELKLFISNFPDAKIISKALYFRALSFLQLKNKTAAKKLFEEIANEHPKSEYNLDAKINLGGLYFDEKKYLKAITIYSKTLPSISSPTYKAITLEKLGLSYIQSGQKKKGMSVLKELAKMYPDSEAAKRVKRRHL